MANNPIKISVVDDDEETNYPFGEQPSVEKATKKPAKKKTATKKPKTVKALKKPSSTNRTETAKPDKVEKPLASRDNKSGSPLLPKEEATVKPEKTSAAKAVVSDGRENTMKKPVVDIALAGGKVKEAVDALKKEEEQKDLQAETEPSENLIEKIASRHSIKAYKKIAYSFLGLTLVLLAVVAYFTMAKVTIVLIPNQERIGNNLMFDVYDQEKNTAIADNVVAGIVQAVELNSENKYPAGGEEAIGEELSGKVTIINNYTKNQPLVATTRLLTPDGKLFRIKDTVNVPAGGSVEVGVYADQPSKDMSIGPTTFTIPGLWAGVQDKIYAESKEEIKYQQQVKKFILQDDIDKAIADMKQNILAKAKADINEKYKDYEQIIYKVDEASAQTETEAKPQDEKEEFTVKMKANVVVVAFKEDKPAQMAQEKFTASLPQNKELISFEKDNIIYSLNNFDLNAGTANLTATFEGKISLKEDTSIVELDKIMGLSKDQLEAHLESLPDIAGFEVKFYPSFIKRVPRLVDRIKVEIKK